jgi:hypothetical protein
MLVSVPAATVMVSESVPVAPLSEAVIDVDPAATPVTNPEELIVATEVFAIVQVAVEVTLPVELSL